MMGETGVACPDRSLVSREQMGQSGPAPASRRSFFSSLAGSSARRVDEPLPSDHLLRLSRPAMACTFELFLRATDRSGLPEAHEALGEIDRLEAQLSIYRDDSEITGINRRAGAGPVVVERRLYALLRRAHAIGLATGGAYDLTTGALTRCWGFLRREGRVPAADALEAARAACGWTRVVFDDERTCVRFTVAGVELNLGSIGKGYALDCVAARLRRVGIRDFLLHAGHSSILASGTSGTGEGWAVAIKDPRGPRARLGVVRLRDRALSTSGVGEQGFDAGGRRHGHILDPRTGWPSDASLQCTVAASDAARAEALSTAFFVMDEPEVRVCMEEAPDVGRVSVRSASRGDPPIVERLAVDGPAG